MLESTQDSASHGANLVEHLLYATGIVLFALCFTLAFLADFCKPRRLLFGVASAICGVAAIYALAVALYLTASS